MTSRFLNVQHRGINETSYGLFHDQRHPPLRALNGRARRALRKIAGKSATFQSPLSKVEDPPRSREFLEVVEIPTAEADTILGAGLHTFLLLAESLSNRLLDLFDSASPTSSARKERVPPLRLIAFTSCDAFRGPRPQTRGH